MSIEKPEDPAHYDQLFASIQDTFFDSTAELDIGEMRKGDCFRLGYIAVSGDNAGKNSTMSFEVLKVSEITHTEGSAVDTNNSSHRALVSINDEVFRGNAFLIGSIVGKKQEPKIIESAELRFQKVKLAAPNPPLNDLSDEQFKKRNKELSIIFTHHGWLELQPVNGYLGLACVLSLEKRIGTGQTDVYEKLF